MREEHEGRSERSVQGKELGKVPTLSIEASICSSDDECLSRNFLSVLNEVKRVSSPSLRKCGLFRDFTMPDETFAGEDESAIESRKSSRSSRRLTKKAI